MKQLEQAATKKPSRPTPLASQMRNAKAAYARPKAHVVAAVLHELLNVEHFDTYADVAESVKCRCARLRIPYDATVITDAIRTVERSRLVAR